MRSKYGAPASKRCIYLKNSQLGRTGVRAYGRTSDKEIFEVKNDFPGVICIVYRIIVLESECGVFHTPTVRNIHSSIEMKFEI